MLATPINTFRLSLMCHDIQSDLMLLTPLACSLLLYFPPQLRYVIPSGEKRSRQSETLVDTELDSLCPEPNLPLILTSSWAAAWMYIFRESEDESRSLYLMMFVSLLHLIGAHCFQKNRLWLLCFCAQLLLELLVLQRSTRPLKHTHTNAEGESCCFTNCSPLSISDNFIYSLFVLSLFHCSLGFVMAADLSLPSSLLPSAFFARWLLNSCFL